MRARESYFTESFTRCRRSRRFNWLRFVMFLSLAFLIGWMLSGCRADDKAPDWVSGSVMGLAFFAFVVSILCAGSESLDARARLDNFGEAVWPCEIEAQAPASGDVFAPMRSPGEKIPEVDVERILVACAAEARCVMKHLARAREHSSLAHREELDVADARINAVARCIEALIERMAERIEKRKKERGRAV